MGPAGPIVKRQICGVQAVWSDPNDANSHHLLSLMNQPSVSDRSAGAYQRAAIGTPLPIIASFPINPVPAARKHRKRILRATRKAIKCAKFATGLPTKRYALA